MGPLLAGSSGAVSLRGLVLDVQGGPLPLAVDGVLAALAGGYLAGTRRLRRRGRPWSATASGCFLCGLAVLFVALCGGIAAHDEASFPVHMTQHVLLMMVAPPLLVLGCPVRLVAQAAPRSLQRRLVGVVHSLPARVLVGPVAWLLYFGTMWGYVLSPLYADSLRSATAHGATHAGFLAVGLCYWESIIGGDGRRPVSPVVRGIGLMVSAPVESALGLVLMVRTRALAGASLAATHAGGQLFWMEAMAVMGVALFATLWGWARDEEHRRSMRFASATRHLLDEAERVVRSGVAHPGDVLIRPDEDEP